MIFLGYSLDIPWNTLEFSTPEGITETQYISKTLGLITNFARQNDVLMVIVAHPRKMEKKDGIFEVPNLYSISGSSHFFNKTDYGITVYRTDNDDVEIHIQKVKFRHLGKTGMVAMKNNFNNGRYQEMGVTSAAGWNNKPLIGSDESDLF